MSGEARRALRTAVLVSGHGSNLQAILDRVAAGVLGLGVGEHLADVAKAGGAEDRVGERMADDVGVAVADAAHRRGDQHAAEDDAVTGREAVRIVADADADGGHGAHAAAGAGVGAGAGSISW